MTPTPRTEAECCKRTYHTYGKHVAADFARTLERDIHELNERLIDRQETLMQTLIENQNLRRQLTESLNNLARACSQCGESNPTPTCPQCGEPTYDPDSVCDFCEADNNIAHHADILFDDLKHPDL